ncbi:uncharacterized protein [Drosophila virilis]|uniref:Uncharacterized protein, isoform A n=1 Tax=Drosophila virilis TaxID=7244 RepID=A0A0Q9WAM9_DROVI|nr:uncharacterized protein LOC26530569 [Drosophila virilis]KRF81751.1 uncharacterized protein Dvir_GJ25799, isoform A [Drosophila virilis]KRF81752.1 uncharacterized protein Dvir_GJ25799, isoform B [Drosophila virilis]
MSFIKQFASTTVGMMAIAIGSTAVVYCTNRFLIKPYQSKKQRLEAEACAEYIFQQESQKRG